MENRRNFIKILGMGIASSISFPQPIWSQDLHVSNLMHNEKDIRIGMIGAENNHSKEFSTYFNINKFYPGVRVSHIWGETRALAEKVATNTNIPNIVSEPIEMLGKVNALIVVHRDGKYHLEAAYPFIKEGIPTFIDKPFCIEAKEAKKFLQCARTHNAAVTSYSSVAYTDLTEQIKIKLNSLKRIGNVVIYGPGRVHSKYSGMYYYAVHCLQILSLIFGDNIRRVRVTGSKLNVMANLEFENGFLTTIVFVEEYYGFRINIESEEGLLSYKPSWETNKPKLTADMVNMFRNGENSRPYQDIINEVSTLEALNKSLKSQKWETVKYLKL